MDAIQEAENITRFVQQDDNEADYAKKELEQSPAEGSTQSNVTGSYATGSNAAGDGNWVHTVNVNNNTTNINYYSGNSKSKKKKKQKKEDKDKKKKNVNENQAKKRQTSARLSEDNPAKRPMLERYPMSAIPRGIMLIINNKDFDGLSTRDGTDRDCENLEKTFRDKLGFKVEKRRNLKLGEMKEEFRKMQQEDHSSFDCFAAAILSHGIEDGICGTDYDKKKKEVLKVEDIETIINGCRSLAGKPKLLFFQACRGGKSLQSDDESPAVSRSDVLIGYPTIHGFESLRHKVTGSWYIGSLCEVLNTYAHSEELRSMLTMINDKVGEKSGKLKPEEPEVKQISEFISRLKKDLYFWPTQEAPDAATVDSNQKQTLVSSPGISGIKLPRTENSSGDRKENTDSDSQKFASGKEKKPSVPESKMSYTKLSTLLTNKKKLVKPLRLIIHDIELESERSPKDDGTWLPARFRVMDKSAWAYLTIFGQANRIFLKKGKSILVQNATVKEQHITCRVEDIVQSPESVETKDEIIKKMHLEEEYKTLAYIQKNNTFQKTKVFIAKVGDLTKQHSMNEKPYSMRVLQVKDVRSSGVYGKDNTLLAFGKAAKFPYKIGDYVVICNVGKGKNKGEFKTVRECLVKKCDGP